MRVDSERIPDIGPTSFWDKLSPGRLFSRSETIPVLRLSGTIGAATPLRQGLTIAGCATALERAFSIKNAPAVVLQINSPGGSPVQSRLIYERIRSLARQKRKKVYAFAEDVAASGGYMLACAADEIYADGSSLVGSIGVISSGFGAGASARASRAMPRQARPATRIQRVVFMRISRLLPCVSYERTGLAGRPDTADTRRRRLSTGHVV
jgi:membrane-bound ClpP family serine protease